MKNNKYYFYDSKEFIEELLDNDTGLVERLFETKIDGIGATHYHVSQTKVTDRGINCTRWFSEKKFKERYK